MTTKLNQVIAIEKGVKSRVYGELTNLNKVAQKPDLFNGLARTYQSKDDDGEKLPDERKRVQASATDLIRQFANAAAELMGVTARKDWTNCVAKADVVIDGKTIVTGAPVSYLLFLEKQLTDFHTFVGNVPVLDESESWTFDANSGLFKSDQTSTHRTKKVARAIVLYPATEQHPAQTQLISEDVIAGFWNQVKQSGAMPKPKKLALLAKTEGLLRAIKEAREAANSADVVVTPPVSVFDYLLEE